MVLRIILDHELVVRDSALSIIRSRVQNFSQAKIRGDVVWVELQSMLKVLGCLLSLSCIGLQSSKMKACTEMFLIYEKALFEELDGLFVVLALLMNHSEVIVRIDIGDWLLQGFLIAAGGFLEVPFFLPDATHRDQGVRDVFINGKSPFQELLRFIKGARLSQEYLTKLGEDISIVRVETQRLFHVLDTLNFIAISDVDPAEAEVSPWRGLVKINSLLEVLGSVFEVFIFFEALAHLNEDLEVFGLDGGSLFVEFECGVNVLLILLHCIIALYFELHVLLEVWINPRHLLHAFLSLSEPFLFDVQLCLSQMSPTVPGVVPDKSRAFFECPCLPVDNGVLGIDAGGDVLPGGPAQGI